MRTPPFFFMPSPAQSDYASEMDRIWFEQHPRATERTRHPFPAELVLSGGKCTSVWVYQIAPGVRIRMPICTSKGSGE